MAIWSFISTLSFFLLASRALALQVTPNSPCAAICLDDASQDVSDPKTSNTFADDIVCLDSGYAGTAAGKKYKACVSCLQASSASGSGENDQGWFLYNLRYTLSSCLFDLTNVTDAVNTPCSTQTSCGPLQQALEHGILDPENESTYAYCSADSNAFLGSYLDRCIGCLQGDGNEKYLANYLVALQAGCLQRPNAGMLIGIQGSVFSTTPVNITYPGYSPSSPSDQTKGHKGLSQGAIIGIAVGLGVLLLIVIATLFICFRKRTARQRMIRLKSPLDSRFGSKTITSPNNGAYGNPYAMPPITVNEAFNHTAFSAKELAVLGHAPPVASMRHSGGPKDKYLGVDTQPDFVNPPSYLGPAIPIHQAYIPATHTPISPATSIATNTTYQASNHPSTKSSPRNIPPPIQVPQAQQYPPQEVQPSEVGLAQEESSRIYPPLSSHQRQGSRSLSRLQQHFQRQESSRIYPHALHSQQKPDFMPTSRSHSHPESWKQGTSLIGVGNANASMEIPLQISGPMIRHGARFDFELAERERLEIERNGTPVRHKKKKPENTPSSAESEEQWPGAY